MSQSVPAAIITRLAATLRPSTKTAARAALRSVGLRQTLCDDVLAATQRLHAARKTRITDRIARHLGYCPVSVKVTGHSYNPVTHKYDGAPIYSYNRERDPRTQPTGRPAVHLPRGGTLAQRLSSVRQNAAIENLRRLIEPHAHGTWTVCLTRYPEDIGIKQSGYYTGEKAGKWSIEATDTVLTVPHDYRIRVLRRGLGFVDGLMTIDAHPLEATGCELYAATWLRRTGAKNATAQRGYIARSGDTSHHADTAEKALAGLRRKAKALATTAALAAADLGQLVQRHASATVRLADATAVGACDPGIRHWCATVGLSYAAGTATLSDVYQAYQREPRPEAHATIVRVLRRLRAVAVA